RFIPPAGVQCGKREGHLADGSSRVTPNPLGSNPAACGGLKPISVRSTQCEALALDPNNAVAWSNKGNALCRLKRYQEAVAAYDKALAIDPKYAQALRNKAISLRTLGRIAEADEAERRANALGGRGCCRPIDSDQLYRHLQPTLLQPAVADAARGMVYHRQLHDSPTSALR